MHLSENSTAIPRLCLGFLHTMKNTVTREGGQLRRNEKPCMPCLRFVLVRKLVGFVQELFQGMALAIVLCPLAAFYGLGLYITFAGSVWRLIQRDYGSSSGDGANKNPALYVLYILAVFQGTVFIYRVILGRAGKRIANQVAEKYGFEDHLPVLGYLDVVIIGCEKDPSFAKGRNLITYAVDLMELESPDDLLSGTRILDTLITYDQLRQCDQLQCRHMPMVTERLIGSSSSGKIFQKLLKAVNSRSPFDSEMTQNAAKIVLSLAGDIRLKQFPEVIETISSLLEASQREVEGYKELMLKGLHIIEKLATDKDNCGVMSNTHGLLGKILNPLSSDILHRVSHDAWPEVVDASLQVLCTWLATVVGVSRRELHQKISDNQEAISAMQSIVVCDVCPPIRHLLAIKVLITQLYKKEGDKVVEVQLLEIFLHYNEDEYIVGLAGEKLVMLSKESKSNAEIILCGSNRYVQEIESLLSNTNRMSKSRICAAGILEGLCSHYAVDNDYFRALKTTLMALMPEVLRQIFPPWFQAHMDIPADALDIVLPISFGEVLHTLQHELPGEILPTLPHVLIQKLSLDVLFELSPEVLLHELLQKLCTEVLQTFLHEFLQKLPHEFLKQLSPQVLHILLHELLPDIPHEFLRVLPEEFRYKLSPQGLRTFHHKFQENLCTKVLQTLHSHDFLQTCPDDFLEKLSPELLQTFPHELLQKLSAEVLQTLPHEFLQELPHELLQKISAEVLQTFPSEFLQKLPHELLQKLSAEVLQTFPREFLQKLPHALLQTLPHDLQMAINAENAEWYDENKLQVALLSLWLMMYDKLIIPDHDLPLLLIEIISEDPEFNFPRRLMGMVDVNSDPKSVDCLRILVLVAKMTVLMTNHIHIYGPGNLKSLIASLKKASRIMINLDAFVHLSGGDGGDSLSSLVQKAHEFFGPSTFETSVPSTYEHGQSSTS